MNAVSESITLQLDGAQLTIPRDAIVKIWLEKMTAATRRAPEPFTPPRIGAQWPDQGGVYAGVMRGESGAPDYHLIVPTDAAAATSDIKWGGEGQVEPGAQNEFDGLINTLALLHSKAPHPAAEWAAELEIGDHCDFYLPARRELSLMLANVPELFEKAWHWSSTQCAPIPSGAWGQHFDNGGQYGSNTSYAGRARAVRRLNIQ
ncbi:hypothetical protein [Janthinobacterium sp.]|uniref:hypothetical protein n=1 Tax=Janthinobacterium sp. TaxID=1871054 RepID=UPI00293D4724|nr:hypothetical protein [Janthinobacterium sp.]